jgi:hypothetical protein
MWGLRLASVLLFQSNREAQLRWLYHTVAKLDVPASMYSKTKFQRIACLSDCCGKLELFQTNVVEVFTPVVTPEDAQFIPSMHSQSQLTKMGFTHRQTRGAGS